ncbi:hypothetical protein, partial [Mycobacterium marinum]|uniref:hypothetical protein n=1 Tax=Mycobacterium marinum TaxID=1781 RepID=UPI0035673191
MNLELTGQSFSEAHPIASILSNTWIFILSLLLIFIAFIVINVIKSKYQENKYIIIGGNVLILIGYIISAILVICLVIRVFYHQDITYSGQARITDVGGIDDNGE